MGSFLCSLVCVFAWALEWLCWASLSHFVVWVMICCSLALIGCMLVWIECVLQHAGQCDYDV